MNWSNSEARAKLVDEVGVPAYNALVNKQLEQLVVVTVAGHSIRPTSTQFGTLWQVGDTGQAFLTQKEAEAYAQVNPI